MMHAVELQRERWRRARTPLRLLTPTADDFALGGLAQQVPGLSVRLLILPTDPDIDHIPFNEEMWDWWLDDRPTPAGKGVRGMWPYEQPTSSAAVRSYHRGNGDWQRYCALHRHGGLEIGMGEDGARTVPLQFGGTAARRMFFLVPIVGMVWIGLDLYRAVANRFSASGPYEVTVALRDTTDAALGRFAPGWDYPGSSFDQPSTCREPSLLARREVDSWPDAEGVQQLAMELGGWVEDSWGSRERRFLARTGKNVGAFSWEWL